MTDLFDPPATLPTPDTHPEEHRAARDWALNQYNGDRATAAMTGYVHGLLGLEPSPPPVDYSPSGNAAREAERTAYREGMKAGRGSAMKKPSAAERKVLECYEKSPALLRVPCTNDYCNAQPGDPCRSSRGNLTLPHVSRVTAAQALETKPAAEIRTTAPLSADDARASTGTRIPLRMLRRDGGTQPREAINREVVAEYAEAIAAGDRFPPVTVFYDGSEYWLADGFHRVAAHEEAGWREVPAEIRQGTRRDAVLHSVGANANHGLRRTNADKRRAVRVLLEDAEWQKLSNAEIARLARVTDKTVAGVRRELESTSEIPRLETRIGADGKERPVAKLAAPDPAEAPAVVEETRAQVSTTVDTEEEESELEGAPTQGVDLVAELERAHREIDQLHQQMDALESDDQAGELRKALTRCAQLEGRIQQLVTESGEAKRQATYYGGLLKQYRQVLGVRQTQEILPRLKELVGGVA